MAEPWQQQQQDHIAWEPTPARAFQVHSALQPTNHHHHEQQRQRIGSQPLPSSSSPPSALWLPPTLAATATSAPTPPVVWRHYAEDPGTGEFRSLAPRQLAELAAAAAADDPGDAALELLRLQHALERDRAPGGCFCCPALCPGVDQKEEEEDDEARVEAYLRSHPDAAPHSAQGAAAVSALCRVSADATRPCDGRAALLGALVLLAALASGLGAGAAVASTAVAYGQATARAAFLDAHNPAVWTSALVAALGAAGVALGRALLAISAAAAVLASALSGFPLPSASPFSSSSSGLDGGGDEDDKMGDGQQEQQQQQQQEQGEDRCWASRRRNGVEPRRDTTATTGWAAAAFLFAGAHFAGLVAAPAEADLGARPPPTRVPFLWHGATVARCALFGAGWAACCLALARRAMAGERAARRGRAAAWRAGMSARALVFGGRQQQQQSRRQLVMWG